MALYHSEATPLFVDSVYPEKNAERFREIRHGFIRKVYGIVSAQLLLTIAVATAFTMTPKVEAWTANNGRFLPILCFIGVLLCTIPLICCRRVARRYPHNYILLAFFTAFQSVLVASMTCVVHDRVVIRATVSTALIVTGLTLFAFQTKYDFTSVSGILFILALILLQMVFIAVSFHSPLNETIAISLGLVVFCAYLVIDTQRMVGKGSDSLSEDDYIIAAMMLYIDIIHVFLHLIRLFRHSRD